MYLRPHVKGATQPTTCRLHMENETMTKKSTATVPATEILTAFKQRLRKDIKLAVKTMTSGRDVAAAFDARFAFDWTRYKGNASAENAA
jgi:hypothetical protein